LLWRSLIAFLSEPQLIGDVEEGAEERGPIIVDEID
jgi:hypothetical protein